MESLRALLAEQEDRLTRQAEMLSEGGMTPKEKLLGALQECDVEFTIYKGIQLGLPITRVRLSDNVVDFNELGVAI